MTNGYVPSPICQNQLYRTETNITFECNFGALKLHMVIESAWTALFAKLIFHIQLQTSLEPNLQTSFHVNHSNGLWAQFYQEFTSFERYIYDLWIMILSLFDTYPCVFLTSNPVH